MSNLILRIILVVTLSQLLMACSNWAHIRSVQTINFSKSQVTLPKDWVINNESNDYIFLTKEGTDLQVIGIEKVSIDKSRQKNSAKNPVLLAHQNAEHVITYLRSYAYLRTATIESIEFNKQSNKSEFTIELTFKNSDGLNYRMLVRSVLAGNEILIAYFRSIDHHFYKEGLPDFERLVASWH